LFLLGQFAVKIFVCEYITGGGLYREALPVSLVEEGTLMRDAVLRDLRQIPEVHTFCTHDSRTPAPQHADETIAVPGDEPWQVWQHCIAKADAVLPIAPECGNALLELTRMVCERDKLLLGCGMEGIALATSKLATSRALRAAGVNAVPTWPAPEFPADSFQQCVVKPDDGAGCEGARILESRSDFLAWLAANPGDGYIAQHFLDGTPASLSMLCDRRQGWLLSCNLQKISVQSGQFVFEGSLVNGAREYWPEFERLAQAIAHALPVLSGYIGVDVIIHARGISVLEINPRLTTSYAGLHQAMDRNPAELLLDLLYNSRFSSAGFRMPTNFQRNEVDVTLHG
jgi:predicted ATP-grasp superfamily ATP-dependent carboligase